jgi:hypothetical protein
MLGSLMSWKRSGRPPDHAALRSQIASMLITFVAVRGWPVLLSGQTVAAMRRQFDTFITAELCGIESLDTIVAVVSIKDAGCYKSLKELQSDKSLRDSAFGRLALNRLADQITEALLRQVETA